MRATNLHVLFKQSSFQPENIEHYICGLLAKFELALDFDKKHLLIPSLLPKEQDMYACIRSSEDVKVLGCANCPTLDHFTGKQGMVFIYRYIFLLIQVYYKNLFSLDAHVFNFA